MLVLRLAPQTALTLDGDRSLCEHRDAVPALLAVPHRAVARGLDIGHRESVVAGLQFLQAHDIGLRLGQIFDQPGQTRLDTV